jgi:WD40 repeat protein
MAAALTHRLTACLTLDAVLLFAEISSDGKQLLTLTGVRGAEICVWNVHSFAQTARLPVTSVPCLARFSPDGSRIITGDRDGAVSVWSIAGQRLEHTLDHHRDQILDVQFETKTERMLVCSADSSISMWHFPSCEFLGTVARESVTIRSVSTLAATDRIACACVNGSLSLWDSIECNRITELAPDRVWRASQSSTPSGGAWVDPNRAHTGALTVARFSPNGLYLATASLDCTVKVWNVSSFHRNAVRSHQISVFINHIS